MGVNINIGDNWKDLRELKINIGDVWKTVEDIKINIGDTWKDVYTFTPWSLTYVETEDDGGVYQGVTSNDDYIFVATGLNGLVNYTCDSDGALTHVDTEHYFINGSYIDVHTENDFVFVTIQGSGVSRTVVACYEYDENGILNLLDEHITFGWTYKENITGDGNKLIFTCNFFGSFEYGFIQVLTYDVDGNISELVNQQFDERLYDIFHPTDAPILFSVGEDGLTSYSVNQTTGALTVVDTGSVSGIFCAINGNNDGLLYIMEDDDDGTGHAVIYSYDIDGNLTFEDNYELDSISYCYDIAHTDEFLFFTDKYYVYCFRLDENNDLVYESTTGPPPSVFDQSCCPVFLDNVFVVSGLSGGMRSYTID